MGMVNESAERAQQRLIAMKNDLEGEAREYAKLHPDWVDEHIRG